MPETKQANRALDSMYNDIVGTSMLGSYSVRRLTFYGILFGLWFPAFAWVFDIFVNNLSFSWESIKILHQESPLHFIIDTAPVILGITAYYISKRYDRRRKYLQKVILERNELIQKNAELAESIGAGNFDVETTHISENDKLGQSLIKMLKNLQENTLKEAEQNWIAKGKEIVSRVLSQQTNIEDLAYNTLVELIKYTDTIQGAFYIFDDEKERLINIATYAYQRRKYINQEFKIGQGLVGQAAYEKDIIYRADLPEDYITISSGILGDKKPGSILIVPLISDEKVQGVIELASLYDRIEDKSIQLIKEQSNVIAQTLFNLKVNVRTEKLLAESQELTKKLQKNEEVLRQNAKQMKQTQLELTRSNRKLASQIEEVRKGQERTH
ncbi:MAG: GAF domain-containing protein, partial [Bacteroidales bacterium]|nr:GAF domain-containing protein [Bacteroidales bacterium]